MADPIPCHGGVSLSVCGRGHVHLRLHDAAGDVAGVSVLDPDTAEELARHLAYAIGVARAAGAGGAQPDLATLN